MNNLTGSDPFTRRRSRHIPAVFAVMVVALAWGGGTTSAETFIVKDGRPGAEIVIADRPPRMVALAAEQLQSYIERISGATLPIVTAATGEHAIAIYIGRSDGTDRLGVTADGLAHGAYRMVAGDGYLVLLGRDRDFVPPDNLSPEAWDQLTGGRWQYPFSDTFKHYNRELDIWSYDQRGSLNATFAFLHDLGVRWYLPHELGEIVPQQQTIALPDVDRTVHPDFALRYPVQSGRMFRQPHATREEVLWQLRMGFNQAPDLIGELEPAVVRGIPHVLGRDATKAAHPEWYELHDGVRQTDKAWPCLSSEGLFEANVAYVRALFDHYDMPMVSVMPASARLCECALCAGQQVEGRGWEGSLSNHVWGYVDRLAREVYKTHPDRKVSCNAYGTYLLPPTNIDTLSPNVVVSIRQWRVNFHDEVTSIYSREAFESIRAGWLARLPAGDKRLLMWESSHSSASSLHKPAFIPHLIARDLRSLKGISLGDWVEVHRSRDGGIDGFGVDHLNLYVTARLWWHVDEDVDALLEEYYTLYYGPAREQMKAFIEYCQANHMHMESDPAAITTALDLLDAAGQAVAPDTVYGQRIALVVDQLQPLVELRDRLARGRQDVPHAHGHVGDDLSITVDGRLDEPAWQGLDSFPLKVWQSGDEPTHGTAFKARWSPDEKALYVGIVSQEADVQKLDATATEDGDLDLFNGDCIEILLETQHHSYYQITVNPAGAMVDIDRQQGLGTRWASNAQAAAHVGDDSWSVEVRIPVVDPSQHEVDTLKGVVGVEPTEAEPWHINIVRQRVGAGDVQIEAFSPAGHVHDVLNFGRFTVK